jgi:hypothetical protein
MPISMKTVGSKTVILKYIMHHFLEGRNTMHANKYGMLKTKHTQLPISDTLGSATGLEQTLTQMTNGKNQSPLNNF